MAQTNKYGEDGTQLLAEVRENVGRDRNKDLSAALDMRSASPARPARRQSSSPARPARGTTMRYYAVRADPKIVGKVEDGGAFGIHEGWDDVKKFAWKGTEPVKAAMASNYKRFGTRAEAEAYLLTEREDFMGRREAQRMVKLALLVLGLVLGLGLCAFLSQQMYDFFECSRDWLGVRIHCSALKKSAAWVATYQMEIMAAAGSAVAIITGVLVEKVISSIARGVF